MPHRDRLHFLLLNVGHFLDHMFTLIFATVAALALSREWGMSYARPAEICDARVFRVRRLRLSGRLDRRQMEPRGHDGRVLCRHRRWRRSLTGLSQTPLQIGLGLFAIGMFAAIYHPVGLAIVVAKWKNTGMRIAVNGVWGNLGVASAALLTGYLIDNGGWRAAFIAPGVFSILIGLAYAVLRRREIAADRGRPKSADGGRRGGSCGRASRRCCCACR